MCRNAFLARLPWTFAGVAVALTVSAWLTTTAAQQGATGTALLVSDLSAPGIDRGLRANDLPRPPRTGIPAVQRPGSSPERFLRGSIIVKFRPGTSDAGRRAMLASAGGVSTPSLPYADFDLVSIDPAADPERVALQLDAQPDVEYAQARYRMHPMFTPNDPLYSSQWNYPAIDMERAWDINPGAADSVVVAVIDSGVAYRSGVMRYFARAWGFVGGPSFPALGVIDVPFAPAPDLGGENRFVAPRDFIWNNNLPFDLDGHGTHVAGTVGQLTNNGVGVAGMAFNVRIMPVKVISDVWDFVFGSPFEGTDDVVARGIRYAADNGAKVLNMSIGRAGPPAPVLQDAVNYAVGRGAFVVAAAGNAFLMGNPVSRPADVAPSIEGMVAVGAIARDRLRARYSNTGSYVELAAPGGDQVRHGLAGGVLQQTYDDAVSETYLSGPSFYRAPRFDMFVYQFFQGTSMAAPHVSGFAALLIQQGITSPAAIEAIMTRYATDLGPPGRDDEFGHGLINPRAALRGMGLQR